MDLLDNIADFIGKQWAKISAHIPWPRVAEWFELHGFIMGVGGILVGSIQLVGGLGSLGGVCLLILYSALAGLVVWTRRETWPRGD